MDNTNKNPIFSIKNFRSFGEDGADFELAPITVLTGCNSAGKSSLVKALMLLSEMPHTVDSIEPTLKLYKKEMVLGTFRNVINKDSQDKKIEISYKVWSNYLQQELCVKRFFSERKKDELNDAHQRNLEVFKTNGQMIFNQSERELGKEVEWVKSIENEYNNFSLVNEYFCILRDIFLVKDYITEDPEMLKHYEECLQKKASIKASMEKSGVNPKEYLIPQLNSWLALNKKNKENEEKYKRLMNKFKEEDVKETIESWFPEMNLPQQYLSRTTEEAVSPWFLQNSIYVDSASAIIKRIYSIEDTSKMSVALRNLYSRMQFQSVHPEWFVDDRSWYWSGSFINRWVKKFDLGDALCIRGDNEGGLKVYLKKGNDEHILADEGYGITQLASLLLTIDNSISNNSHEEIKSSWEEFESGDFKKGKDVHFPYKPRIICVEEPEVHLHPKYQSLLADMFVEAYQKYNIHFIIETHSEYLIRKLQLMVADKDIALTSNDVSLNYVEKNEDGISHNRQIKILEDGRLSEPFGPGFYDEADTLAMELMKYKARKK